MTLPIAFSTSVYFADVSADNIGWADTPSYKVAPTLTQITVILQTHTNPNLRIFCIGYQQWGRNNVATTSFPVTFSVLYVMAFGYESWGNATYENYPWVTRSTTGFNTPTYKSAYLSWWALGVQQWGKSSSSGRATTTVTLPLTMPVEINNVVISQAAASDTWSTWSSIVSTSQIKLTNNYGPGSWWFVTGRQQWGYASAFAGSKYITLPLSATPIAVYASFGYQTETAYVATADVSDSQVRLHNCGSHTKAVYWSAVTK